MIPPEVSAWLTEKVEAHRWSGVVESRRVTHTWSRSTGGRVMSAGLSAAIWPAEDFSLQISAQGVEPTYVAGARNGLFSVLLSYGSAPILRCAVEMDAFQVRPGGSSYAAFYSVAKEATERLLGIRPPESPNIEW
jgi:hypothetical protein